MASSGVALQVLTASMIQLLPRPFGPLFQVVINATSFSSIIGQLHEVANSAASQQDEQGAPPVTLLVGGCFSNNATGHGPNCTLACADPASMFNSSFTFWNCVTLASASILAKRGDITFDEPTLASVGSELGFNSLDSFDGPQILENTLECVKASCDDYSLGTCDASIGRLNVTTSADPVADLFEGLKGYCAGVSSIVNSDIAGPGVVMSYILQAAIAILFSLMTNLLSRGLQPLIWLTLFLLGRMSSQTSELSAWKRAGLIQKKLSRSRPAIAVVSALVEFQEVQGFFVAAIQFATLAVYTAKDNAALLSSMSSFSEAVLNTDVVQTLSVNGVLPVLFIQISLLRCGVRWWYMLSIVVLVFVLAAVIMSLDLTPDFDTLWTYFKESAPIVRCGGNPSPMTYCLDALTDLDNVLKPLNTGIIIGCVAVPAFIIHQLWPSVSAWLDVDRWLDAGETKSQVLIVIRRRIWPVASVVLWAGLELWLLIYVGFYLKALLTIMSKVSKDSSEWGYGQLVAVMVWAPVLGKYIYFNIFGIEDGVGRRLPPQYRIIETEDDGKDGGLSRTDTTQQQGVEMGSLRVDSFVTLKSKKTFESVNTITESKTPYVRRRHLSDVSGDFKI